MKRGIGGVSRIPFRLMEGGGEGGLARYLQNAIVLYIMRLDGDAEKITIILIIIKKKIKSPCK